MAWAELLQRSLGAIARILMVDASRCEPVAAPQDAPLVQLRRNGVGLSGTAATASAAAPGLTLLTAMSADYAARESAAAGDGILTRHILAARAGAADANQDDRVTLSEVLLYGADRTLRQVEPSPLGDPRGVFKFHLGSASQLALASLPSLQLRSRLRPELRLAGCELLNLLVQPVGQNAVVSLCGQKRRRHLGVVVGEHGPIAPAGHQKIEAAVPLLRQLL